MTTAAAYRKHETAKKREYAQRVREVEHGVFTPLVLSTTGGMAFFDVRVFHPNASSNRSMTTAAAYRKHETAKKREYAQRVREVEHGVFTPLVLSTTGGMAREATTFYKRLADELSRKQDKQYSLVMGWIRCRLSFAILRSAILCIRGSRSSHHRPVRELNIELAAAEGHVPSDM